MPNLALATPHVRAFFLYTLMLYCFSKEEAMLYGVEEAIFLHNLRYWISYNKANKKNGFPVPECYEEIANQLRYWTYNSVEAYLEHFPFWTIRQVRRIIESLLSQGLIIKGCFSNNKYDRTLWYAFADEKFMLDNKKDDKHLSNTANVDLSEKANEELPKTTNVNTDSKQSNSKPNRKQNIAQNKFERLSLSDSNSLAEIKETNISTAKQKKSAANGFAADFELFWNSYPRKVGKKQAETKFKTVVKNVGIDTLLNCLELYKQEIKDKKIAVDFILHPSTFLNGRYEDFLPNVEKQQEIDNSPKYKGISLATEVNYSIAGGTSSKVEFGKFLANCVRYQNNLHNYSYNGGCKISLNEIAEIKDLLANTKYLQ